MIEITAEMKFMIDTQQCYISIINAEGEPKVTTKRSVKMLNDKTIVFNEEIDSTIYKNLINGSSVSVIVLNKDTAEGYRFIGKAEAQQSGKLYKQAVIVSQVNGIREPEAVVLIHIGSVHSLRFGLCAG